LLAEALQNNAQTTVAGALQSTDRQLQFSRVSAQAVAETNKIIKRNKRSREESNGNSDEQTQMSTSSGVVDLITRRSSELASLSSSSITPVASLTATPRFPGSTPVAPESSNNDRGELSKQSNSSRAQAWLALSPDIEMPRAKSRRVTTESPCVTSGAGSRRNSAQLSINLLESPFACTHTYRLPSFLGAEHLQAISAETLRRLLSGELVCEGQLFIIDW
jgi:hypothetical protein